LLQWVPELGFDNTNFSLDSKIVVGAFNGNNNSINDFSSIIISCRELFSTPFSNYKVEFNMGKENGVIY